MFELWATLKDRKIINLFIILSLLALNILLKSIFLGDYNIDLDEPFTLFHSQQTLKELFTIFTWENNPPLFFVIMHFWVKIFGIGIVSARFLPMLFSSLAVVFVYKIGIKFINRPSAIVSSLLYTCSNLIIMEAHDARVYSLLVFLTVASMYFFFSLISTEKGGKYLVALTITNVLLVYSHFLAFFVILLQVIYSVAVSAVRKKIVRKYFISLFFLFISYLPYLYFFWLRSVQVLHTGINTPKADTIYFFSSLFINSNYSLLTILFLFVVLLFVVYAFIKKISLTVYEKMIFGWFFMLYLIIFLVSLRIPIITIPKYLIFIIPGFFLSLSIAINYLSRMSKIIGIGMMLVCVLLMAYGTNIRFSEGLEAKKAVSLIKHNKSNSTIVYIVPFYVDAIFLYHYNIDMFKDYRNYKGSLEKDNIYVLSSLSDIDTIRLKNATDVLLFEGWGQLSAIDPAFNIFDKLNSMFRESDILASLNGYTIYHFKNE